jgi:ABC-type transporter Mla subunit MlaD
MADPEETTPRWVYVFGIIALVLVLAFVILHLTGHGLGGHTS